MRVSAYLTIGITQYSIFYEKSTGNDEICYEHLREYYASTDGSIEGRKLIPAWKQDTRESFTDEGLDCRTSSCSNNTKKNCYKVLDRMYLRKTFIRDQERGTVEKLLHCFSPVSSNTWLFFSSLASSMLHQICFRKQGTELHSLVPSAEFLIELVNLLGFQHVIFCVAA